MFVTVQKSVGMAKSSNDTYLVDDGDIECPEIELKGCEIAQVETRN